MIKKLFYILVAATLCSCNKPIPDAITEGLNGNVNEVRTMCYAASRTDGKLIRRGFIHLSHFQPAILESYDNCGNKVQRMVYDRDGVMTDSLTFAFADGRCIMQQRFNEKREKVGYENKVYKHGKLIQCETLYPFNEEGDAYQYEFDGPNIVTSRFLKNDQLQSVTRSTYKNERMISSITTDTNGVETYHIQFEWTSKGQLSLLKTYSSGKLIFRESLTYDEHGWLISDRIENDGFTEFYSYEYTQMDANGNWTRRIVSDDAGVIAVEEREISYHN